MANPAIAAIQEGARYQYRFFWRQALPMLYKQPPLVERVVMEHRGVEAVDDVVVYYTAPGIKDTARLVRIDYYGRGRLRSRRARAAADDPGRAQGEVGRVVFD